MVIDWTLDFGTILTLIVLISGGVFALAKVGVRLTSLEGKMTMMAGVLEKLSVQKTRLDDHGARLDRLERQMDGGNAGSQRPMGLPSG